jgi:hypothetical protein
MNPTGLGSFNDSVMLGAAASQQVGYGSGPATGATNVNAANNALLWTGTAASAVDLEPTQLTNIGTSEAFDTDGTHQVGEGQTAGSVSLDNAMLWSGTAASAVNLQPTQFAGYNDSVAYGVSGNQQVGVLERFPSFADYPVRPMLWTGTAASAIDLTPTNLTGDFGGGFVAYGIGGGQEVGVGFSPLGDPAGISHAILWSGSAASAVDLNPPGLNGTVALSTNGTTQVGYYGFYQSVNSAEPTYNAMAWQGTAASAVNLQTYLASNYVFSVAYSVDSAGDVFGMAGNQTTGNYDAIEWIPTSVPEPASLGILATVAVFLPRRFRYDRDI